MSKNYKGQDIVYGQEKLLTGKLNCEQKVNYKEHSLECSTVCSRDYGEKQLGVFEMKTWRRIGKICWTDKVTHSR